MTEAQQPNREAEELTLTELIAKSRVMHAFLPDEDNRTANQYTADEVEAAGWVKPEASPSDADRAKAASDYSHQERFMKFRTPMERLSYERHFKAGWDAALSRTSQPVQVEVTDDMVYEFRKALPVQFSVIRDADIRVALSVVLSGGDD